MVHFLNFPIVYLFVLLENKFVFFYLFSDLMLLKLYFAPNKLSDSEYAYCPLPLNTALACERGCILDLTSFCKLVLY